jgi:hypothetical protein
MAVEAVLDINIVSRCVAPPGQLEIEGDEERQFSNRVSRREMKLPQLLLVDKRAYPANQPPSLTTFSLLGSVEDSTKARHLPPLYPKSDDRETKNEEPIWTFGETWVPTLSSSNST